MSETCLKVGAGVLQFCIQLSGVTLMIFSRMKQHRIFSEFRNFKRLSDT